MSEQTSPELETQKKSRTPRSEKTSAPRSEKLKTTTVPSEEEIRKVLEYIRTAVGSSLPPADPLPGQVAVHCQMALCAAGYAPFVISDTLLLHDALDSRNSTEATADFDAAILRVVRPLRNRFSRLLEPVVTAIPPEDSTLQLPATAAMAYFPPDGKRPFGV